MHNKKLAQVWNTLIKHDNLSPQQTEQFERYVDLLLEWNKKINLTSITNKVSIVNDHFKDSLQIDRFVDMKALTSIADVGTGGGFPGVPLKIKYPHLNVVLIEVNNKKITFLQHIIQELGLDGIEVCSLDWRTFLRKTDYDIDLFCVRASLHTDEMIRMFKPGCPYKSSQLVYWASAQWKLGKKEATFFVKEEDYQIDSKQRRLIFFGLKA